MERNKGFRLCIIIKEIACGDRENVMPEISIIIPIYNVEKYLEKCIDSVISQTMDSIEM